MEITFWGATEDVTGSMTFVKFPDGLLALDCGLSQGRPEIEKLNDLPLPYSPHEIKAVILTHAHLDHSGFLPILVKRGFKGNIYSTKATAHLAKIILQDSASLSDGTYFDKADVELTLKKFQFLDWNQKTSLLGGDITLLPAGHILGASSVKLVSEGKTLIYSGDIGRKGDPLIPAPPACPPADAVILESTYGARVRTGDMEKELHTFLMTLSRESKVGLIASFAVARGQMLMTLIHDFFVRHPEDKIRVVFDSPMMAEANEVYENFSHLTKIPDSLHEGLKSTESIEHEGQWLRLRKMKGPLLIISSSGMLTGGRIGRHLLNWHDDKNAILFLPGHQAKGTPGRALADGERFIKGFNGVDFKWKGEVIFSEAFSSHADQNELIEWTENLNPQTRIFLVHGEESSKEVLLKKLSTKGLRVKIPFRCESVSL